MKGTPEYSAKRAYYAEESAKGYMRRRVYRSLVGRRRRRSEERTIRSMLQHIEKGSIILDCPCGTGRWHSAFTARGRTIVAVDISPAMVRYASRYSVKPEQVDIQVLRGDGESLPLKDKSVDYTFCFALMKHLPVGVSKDILREFLRVSRTGMLCSFPLFSPITYAVWRMTNQDPESQPLWGSELGNLATAIGLKIRQIERITPLLGLECVVFLDT